MFRILPALALLVPLLAGCSPWTWQANRASQAVEVDPSALGSGRTVFSPANGPGYMSGEPQDMRRH